MLHLSTSQLLYCYQRSTPTTLTSWSCVLVSYRPLARTKPQRAFGRKQEPEDLLQRQHRGRASGKSPECFAPAWAAPCASWRRRRGPAGAAAEASSRRLTSADSRRTAKNRDRARARRQNSIQLAHNTQWAAARLLRKTTAAGARATARYAAASFSFSGRSSDAVAARRRRPGRRALSYHLSSSDGGPGRRSGGAFARRALRLLFRPEARRLRRRRFKYGVVGAGAGRSRQPLREVFEATNTESRPSCGRGS